jgi:hypothetical protein
MEQVKRCDPEPPIRHDVVVVPTCGLPRVLRSERRCAMGARDLFYSEHLSFRLNFDRPDGSILRLDFDGTSLAREDWTVTLTAGTHAVRLSRDELVHMGRVFPMLAALNRPHADIVGAVHLDLLHIEEDADG